MTKARTDAARIGVIVYEEVEPIDIGGTVGVISMARRLLPALDSVVIARRAGPVRLAGGLTILAAADFATAPPCDLFIVTGGAGWTAQVSEPDILAFLRGQPVGQVASVCTGALILAAAGVLDGRQATTRRRAAGAEPTAPLDLLNVHGTSISPAVAAVVEDRGIVTGGGVSLAIDATLYLIGRLYGAAARDEVADLIEYDRAFAANRAALGHVSV
jgi:transcriptional regulator GlxA family with amidase domain